MNKYHQIFIISISLIRLLNFNISASTGMVLQHCWQSIHQKNATNNEEYLFYWIHWVLYSDTLPAWSKPVVNTLGLMGFIVRNCGTMFQSTETVKCGIWGYHGCPLTFFWLIITSFINSKGSIVLFVTFACPVSSKIVFNVSQAHAVYGLELESYVLSFICWLRQMFPLQSWNLLFTFSSYNFWATQSHTF